MYAPMRGLESPCQLTVAVAASVSAYNWRVPAWFARMPIMSPVSGRSRSTTERIFASGGSKMWTCVDHIRSGEREAEVRGPRGGGGRTSGSGHIGSLSRLVSSRLTISTRTSCAIRMGRPIRVAALISKLSTGTSPRLTSLRTRRYEHIVRGNKGRPLRRGGPSSDWVW